MHCQILGLHIEVGMFACCCTREQVEDAFNGKCQGRAIITSAPQSGERPTSSIYNDTSRSTVILSVTFVGMRMNISIMRLTYEDLDRPK
jgi:hypothetical protein